MAAPSTVPRRPRADSATAVWPRAEEAGDGRRSRGGDDLAVGDLEPRGSAGVGEAGAPPPEKEQESWSPPLQARHALESCPPASCRSPRRAAAPCPGRAAASAIADAAVGLCLRRRAGGRADPPRRAWERAEHGAGATRRRRGGGRRRRRIRPRQISSKLASGEGAVRPTERGGLGAARRGERGGQGWMGKEK